MFIVAHTTLIDQVLDTKVKAFPTREEAVAHIETEMAIYQANFPSLEEYEEEKDGGEVEYGFIPADSYEENQIFWKMVEVK